MINQQFIAQLKAANDIVSVVGSYVSLKNEGRNKKCLCPFHMEKTPSCVVYEDTQSFYCFGCGAGGDVITFIEKIENLDYVEAVKFLAGRVGMTVPEDAADERVSRDRARVLEMNKLAARYFFGQLKKSRPALAYFARRRLTRQTVVQFGLGYAPDSWDGLRDFLRGKGYSYEEMEQADLVSRSKKNTFYDKFRNRVIFPIIDLRGNVVAFGGRVLDDSKPKYLNSSDTPAFKKSNNLFALNIAKNSGRRTLILGEGYMDVIAMHQGGFTNAVATLGTALAEPQARLISRYADEVIIAYDSDGPGQKATERASRIFQEAGVQTRVLQIPGAKDPDEYIKQNGAGRFKLLLEQAGGVTETRIGTLRRQFDLEDPAQKTKYVGACCAVIARLPDILERDVYVGSIAAETGVAREGIAQQVEYLRKKQKRRLEKQEWREITRQPSALRDKINPDSIKYPKAAKAEMEILHFLFQNPDYLSYITQRLSPGEFVTEWHRKVYSALTERLAQGQSIDLAAFHNSFEPDEIGRLSGIINGGRELANTRKALDDCIAVVQRQHERNTENVAEMTPEQIEQLRRKKAERG